MRLKHISLHGHDYDDGEQLLADFVCDTYSTEFEVTESLPLLFRMVNTLGYVLNDF